jgi:hypothetical protein
MIAPFHDLTSENKKILKRGLENLDLASYDKIHDLRLHHDTQQNKDLWTSDLINQIRVDYGSWTLPINLLLFLDTILVFGNYRVGHFHLQSGCELRNLTDCAVINEYAPFLFAVL